LEGLDSGRARADSPLARIMTPDGYDEKLRQRISSTKKTGDVS